MKKLTSNNKGGAGLHALFCVGTDVPAILSFFKRKYGLTPLLSLRATLNPGLTARAGLFQGKQSHPYKVLISTILSQRTKDGVTHTVTKRLFSKYSTARGATSPDEFKSLSTKEIESLIKPVGFYKVKAKWIKEIAAILVDKFDSKVPNTLSELLSLPGVGRKTANCVLAYGFGIPALPVDTHVHRISNRLGIVKTNTPYETEQALMQVIPREYWGTLNTAMVEFGKEICRPVKPRCKGCELNKLCKYRNLQRFVENL
ncbi:MAG: endonuclease III [bacterium]|nr:endonuclease III [bacterium]